MLVGTVKQYDQQKGWGFITIPHEEEVYVHARGIMPADREQLRTGDQVSLVVIQGQRGPQAARVRIMR
ncbi:MAG: cold shock domain-containing protein [[Lactobacillus] timonensis]|jgi:CspA family cold shock protein|uniref:cold-shock protein n=1 Tax=[Lactobacillus] timonensis TaxID=1970790 RepID=UPI000C84D912|nr:cold shock domain-containing protein [[Lactobacillus] timonensis]MCI1287471.1 cold shock domain-containing protein [[Lactobacillus] timonensis]MCI1926151.1 cold shock domain-containing protein [[Lactobacillus] timonensis]MCI1957511.1 cold shock domain-containing protein [[Lactobacillus] timonensis]MCI1970579.1 cold shock domain-containing protein [[Lactobacillus] timonensis]MCI2006705.1 cold shock domain-containing protein [[Lactobacillus] timonensis]